MSWQNRSSKAPVASLYDELRVESIVLAYVTAEHPAGVRISSLSAHFNQEFEQGVEGDAVERAVVELVRNRQLRMERGLVKPVLQDLPSPASN